MKLFKTKMLTSIILIVILFNTNIITSFSVQNFNSIENEDLIVVDEEKKQLCNATMDDDFADDSVVVIFNNETSLKLNTFDKNDFKGLNISSVNDITECKVNSIKDECINKLQGISAYTTNNNSELSSTKLGDNNYYVDKDLKKEYSNFHQMVVLKLENKGK